MSYLVTDVMADYTDRSTGNRQVRASIVADTAADLPTNTTALTWILGSYAKTVDTGDEYWIDSSGSWILQPSGDVYQNVYTKSEIDNMITEIDNMITEVYQTIVYYHTTQTSVDGTITFYALVGVVKSLSIYGNGSQTGTPTPDNPIMPIFCGTLDDTDWTIPITCAGQTTPVYLGQVSTVRKIRRLVLTGEEEWVAAGSSGHSFRIVQSDIRRADAQDVAAPIMSTHYTALQFNSIYNGSQNGIGVPSTANWIAICNRSISSVADFKTYLQQQYQNGTPVCVWYVLANEQTGIVNEPLAKIGTYADELNSEDAGVTIPTVNGSNTLTVDTALPPSLIEISGE